VTQEAEIRRIIVRSQIRQIVFDTLSQKNPSQKKRAGGVAPGVGPEFKPQHHKNKNNNKNKQTNKKNLTSRVKKELKATEAP
jgi:hypothetical protein